MIGLLARVIVGVVFGGVVSAAAVGVYKIITKDSAKDDINNKIKNSDAYKEAFKAKVKEKGNNSVKCDIVDQWDNPLGEETVYGDSVADDIQVGDEFILV